MKVKISKKLLSVFLAVVMIVTSIPIIASAATGEDENNKFLFAYFTGNDGDEYVRLAVSDDGLNFEALNGNTPILNNEPSAQYPATTKNTGIPASGCARDPYVVQARNEDGSVGKGYYIIATDLSINVTNYRNSKFLVWYIDDLSKVAETKPWNVETCDWFNNYPQLGRDGSGNVDYYAWAPEAIWDSEKQMYMLYWSGGADGTSGDGSNYNSLKLRYCYTKDFKTFVNADGQTIGENGVEPGKLIEPGFKSIDGDITFDGQYYWLYFKNEDSKTIYYAKSLHANGPYSDMGQFYDSDYTSYIEGPFIYQLLDDTYVFMADYYASNDYPNPGFFIAYNAANLDGFNNNSIERATNINYLSPRHGAVTRIKESDYYTLIDTYGKVSYDGNVYQNSSDINDSLVARYFINDDLATDATGNGYNLNINNLTASSSSDKTYASFKSNGATSANPSGGSYALVNTSKMSSDKSFNPTDGVTFSWYGNSSANGYQRWFDLTDQATGSVSTNVNSNYAFVSTNTIFETSINGTQTHANGYQNSIGTNTWHLYTFTISENYICLSVDGNILKCQYNDGKESKKGSPLYCQNLNEDWFSKAFNGNLLLGASTWGGDQLLDGYIYDFRIYNKALSNQEVSDSLEQLGDIGNVGKEIDSKNRQYYDPMETATVDGIKYTEYTGGANYTVNDADMGGVLSINNANIVAHNKYNGAETENGYTISLWYNPGSGLDGTIFTVGDTGGDESTKQYFTVLETGEFYFCYNDGSSSQSYVDAKNIFNGKLQVNKWQHITIQIVPNGSYEKVHVYVDGELTSTLDTYRYFDGSGTQSIKSGRSVLDFFTKERNVNYGGSWYWGTGQGFIDGFSIYSDVYNAKSLFEEDSVFHASTLINVAIRNYEEKMGTIDDSNNRVFTNMANAYAAYDEAKRYIDSVNYGHVTPKDEEMAELYVNLVTATNNMQDYTTPETKEGLKQSETRLKTDIPAQYTQNMLSTVNLDLPKERVGGTTGSDEGYVNASVASGSFVWLYDGENTPTAPINGGFYWQGKTGVSFYASSIYASSGDLKVGSYWTFSGGKETDWYYDTNNLNVGNTSADTRLTNYQIGDTYTWHYGSSYINYTGNSSSFSNNGTYTDYFTSFTPAYQAMNCNSWWSFGTQYGTYTHDINSTGPVYVINFAKVKEALTNSSRLNVLANINKYSPDSIKALLDAYDALTSQNYLFDIVSERNVADLAETLYEKVDALNDIDISKIQTQVDYEPAREAADDAQPFHDSVVVDENGDAHVPNQADDVLYTESSWTAYDAACTALEDHYASLNPFGEDQNYATDEADIDRFIDNISTSQAHLMVRADYTPVETVVETDSDYTAKYDTGNVTSSGDQLYTYSAWKNFQSDYDTANSWASKTEDYKADTEKYYVEWAKGEYAPYIAFDSDGNVVTSEEQVKNIESYKYFSEFYDSADATEPSQFQSGDYIKYNGEMIKLNGYRYAPATIDTGKNSSRQDSIYTAADDVQVSYSNLKAPADYTAYDATTELLKYQDMAAFTDDYLNSGSSVYDLVEAQGTKDAQATYSNGVSTGKTVETPTYTDGLTENAYVSAEGRIWKNQSEQSVLDKSTTDILSALEEVNNDTTTLRRQYNVTFTIHLDDEDRDVNVPVSSMYYGDPYTAEITAGGADVNGYSCYRWSVTDNGGTKDNIPASDTYTAMVNGDVTITAYCSKQDPDEDMAKVRILNQYGNAVQEYNVAANTEITVDKNMYQIGDSSAQNVADSPYYRFDGWQANGRNLNNGSSFKISDMMDNNNVVELLPKYNIVADGSGPYTINVDGVKQELGTGGSIYYDTEMTVSVPEGSYGIAIEVDGKYYVASYATSYTFYAVGDTNFYSITKSDDGYTINGKLLDAENDKELIEKLDAQLPFAYSSAHTNATVDGVKKYTTYSATTADIPSSESKVKVTEVGTIYTTDASAAQNGTTFVIGAQNVNRIAAKNQLDTMQYFLRIADSSTTYYTRSYVKYEYTATVKMKDGSSQTTVIQTIDYGNICSSTTAK